MTLSSTIIEEKAKDQILNLVIKAVEYQHRFDPQPWEVGYTEIMATIEKDWDPKTWNGDTQDDALKNLESPDYLELFGPEKWSIPPCQQLAFPSYLNMMQSLFCSTICTLPRIYFACPRLPDQ